MKLLNINKSIIIGTAQLGTNYGIANKNKKIYIKEKIKLLDYCYYKGLISLDTAYAYKNSHKIIGQWIKNNHIALKISTKIPNLEKYHINIIESLIKEFLIELNIKKIENLFLHNPNDWNKPNIKKYIRKVLDENLVSKFGLSIYETRDIFKDPNIKILQIPANIFNQNIINSDQINAFIENGGNIHVRSIFLQGLLLMDPKLIPLHLEKTKIGVTHFQNIAKELKINKTHLAIICIKYLLPKAKIIIGLDDIDQLREILKIDQSDYNESDVKEIIKIGQKYSGSIWDTRKW